MKEKINNGFNEGDRVLISESSDYYGQSSSNPADIVGTILKSSKYRIRVRWDNSRENTYGKRDLIHAVRIIEDDGEY